MPTLTLAATSLNLTPLAWDEREEALRRVLTAARERHVALLALPARALTGFTCEDMFLAPDTAARALALLRRLIPLTRGGLFTALGLPLLHAGQRFDALAFIGDGALWGFACRTDLPLSQRRWFEPWPAGLAATTIVDGTPYPLGDLTFSIDNSSISLRFSSDPASPPRAPADFTLIADATPTFLDAPPTPLAPHGIVLRANLLGCEDERLIFPGDATLSVDGQLLAATAPFAFTASASCEVTLPLPALPTPPHPAAIRIPRSFATPVASPVASPTPAPPTTTPLNPHEVFTQAATLGLWDTLRRTRAHGFVVSLSGGADSATCATLIAFMVARAHAALGVDGLRASLSHITNINNCSSIQDITRTILFTIYQASANSSSTTRHAADALAEALGADHHAADLAPVIALYEALGESALGRPLSWTTDDLTRQNIQARARAPLAWLLANARRALLITTGNRSEATLGYATMDGDTAGGLAPLVGVPKTFIRAWLRWAETEGPRDLFAVPALRFVNAQAPTAELRPEAMAQRDEDDLMPYEVLEFLADLAITRHLAPRAALASLGTHYPELPRETALTWVERFYRLWAQNAWKRARGAPGFCLMRLSVDPGLGQRSPLLSDAFATELRELRSES